MRDLRVALFVAMASLSVALVAETGGETIDLIQERGVLDCWLGAPPAGKYDNSHEVALCDAIAQVIFGDPSRVKYSDVHVSAAASIVKKREAYLVVTQSLDELSEPLDGLVLVRAYTMDDLPIVAIMDENDRILSKLVTKAVESLISEGSLCREKGGCPEQRVEPDVIQEVEPAVKESTGPTLDEVRGVYLALKLAPDQSEALQISIEDSEEAVLTKDVTLVLKADSSIDYVRKLLSGIESANPELVARASVFGVDGNRELLAIDEQTIDPDASETTWSGSVSAVDRARQDWTFVIELRLRTSVGSFPEESDADGPIRLATRTVEVEVGPGNWLSNLNIEALLGAAVVLGLVFWFAMRRRPVPHWIRQTR